MKRLKKQNKRKIENINKDIDDNLLGSSNLLVPTSKLQTLNSHLSHPTSHRSGITLIALVVTIVILLILAGITINLVLAEGGLFDRAKEAEKAQEMAVIKDYVVTAQAELEIENVSPSNKYDTSSPENLAMDIMDANFPNSMTIPDDEENTLTIVNGKFSGSFKVQVESSGNEYEVTITNGKVEVVSTGEGTSGGGSGGDDSGDDEGGEQEPTTIPVESVSLNKATANITLGGTLTLTATINPEGATNKGVTWDSSNKNVATVENGIITTLTAGTTTITVTTNDGSYTATSEITVLTPIASIVNQSALNTNRIVGDEYNNKIVIPADFKVIDSTEDATVVYGYASADGKSPVVQDGIVIENEDDGNQFVWVPVGEINNDTNGSTTTIKLGRYETYTMTTGTTIPTPPNPTQEATVEGYNTATIINNYYFENMSGEYGGTTYSGNTKAYDLEEWIRTTLANKGYYIARYEASYGKSTGKVLSQPSTGTPAKSGDYTINTEVDFATNFNQGQLWNFINQPDAADASRAMYPATTGAKYYSDLVNSYAWDTAIIFIQAYSENTTYASKTSSYTDPTSPYQPANTGERGTDSTVEGSENSTDKVCNIYDMASNVVEWTTETSTDSGFPCVRRSGNFCHTSWYTSVRSHYNTSGSSYYVSFRPSLYVSSTEN